MKGSRERTRLADVVQTQKGYAFKSAWYTDSGRPIVKVSDFTHDSIDCSNLVCIPDNIAAEYLKYELGTGDVVVQTVGSWPSNPASVVGRCVRIPETAAGALLNQNAVKLSPSKYVDPRFLYYLLRNEDFKTYIIGTAQGAASQAAITLESIRAYEFDRPSLPFQRRVAGILSAYDDLIENNQRRIKILEEMARSLYREWFVNFRFPGHESGRRTFNRPNPMPEGWEGRFSELANLERIGINPSEFPDEEFEHFSIPAFDDERRPVVERGETILSSKYRVGTSCVLLSKLNPRIRRVWLPEPSGQRAAIASTEFLVLNPRPGISREFIYAHCCSEEFAEGFNSLAIGTSTSHQRVKPDDLLAMSTIVPDPRTIEFFTCFVRPVFALQQRLRVASTNLRRTRDLLLPRLLSGQVSLDVDEEVPQESGVERREQDEIGLA